MRTKKTNKEEVMKRRAEIAALAVFGRPTQQEIADKLGIDAATVSRHLKILRKEWKEEAARDINEIISEELNKLNSLERETLEEWKRSKLDYEKRTLEETPGANGAESRNKKAKVEKGKQTGDPRYLTVLLGIQDRRAKLLGFDKPQKVAPTTPDGEKSYSSMSDAEMEKRISELMAAGN